jgi:hypothetical protein
MSKKLDAVIKLFHSLGRKIAFKRSGKIETPLNAEDEAATMFTILKEAGLNPDDMHKFIKSESDIIKYLNQIEALNKQSLKQETLASGLGKYFKKEGKVIPFPSSAIVKQRGTHRGIGAGVQASGPSATRIKQGFSTQSKLNHWSQNQQWVKDFLGRKNAEFNSLNRADQKEVLDMFNAQIKKHMPKEPKAYGGIAGMLGEPTYVDDNHRVPYKTGKKVLDLLSFIRSKFGPKSVTTADKLTRPTKAIEAENLKLSFDRLNNKIATQEAMRKAETKMAGPITTKNKKFLDPESTDHTTWLKQEKFFDPKALDMYGKKVPSNWIAKEKKDAQKLIDDLGPLDVSPNHPNYKTMKAIRQSAKDRLESIKITEKLGGNIQMHDWLRMNRKNIKMSDYIKKPGTKKAADELSGIKKAFIQKKLSPEDELRREFPGISDDLINKILTDDNPQRIAEVKATMREALKMQEKGMGPDEIISIFKNMKRTKNATGGLAGMLGE